LKRLDAIELVILNDGSELMLEGTRVYRLPVKQFELV
jgi:hypothetical protein